MACKQSKSAYHVGQRIDAKQNQLPQYTILLEKVRGEIRKMKSLQTRLDALEQAGLNSVPVYAVTFEDATAQRMNAVELLMHLLDHEAGSPVLRVTETRMIRGDPSKFGKLSELIESADR